MLDYRVCAVQDLPKTLAHHRGAHVVSLLDLGTPFPKVPGPHHCYGVSDVNRTGVKGDPNPLLIWDMLEMVSDWQPDTKVVFHCQAGISRSTAAALICDIAHRFNHTQPRTQDTVSDAITTLLARRPVANPNAMMLKLASEELGVTLTMPPRALRLDPT